VNNTAALTLKPEEAAVVRLVSDEIARLRTARITSNREWTRSIFGVLAQYAYKTLGAEACYSGGEMYDHNRAWLADFVIYKNESGHFRRLVLVAECEWWLTDLGDLVYDFEKLLVLRANYRLFIFQAKTEAVIRSNLREFVTAADHHELGLAGDRCLFIALNNENSTTLSHLWVQAEGMIEVPADTMTASE